MPRTVYSNSTRCWFRTKTGGIGHYMYWGFGEYSAIMHLPDNIRPDWLVAAQRALRLARSYKMRTTKEQKAHLRVAAACIKELQRASRAAA